MCWGELATSEELCSALMEGQSFGGQNRPNPVPRRFSRLLDASAAAGIGQLVHPPALEGPGSPCDAKGRMAAVC